MKAKIETASKCLTVALVLAVAGCGGDAQKGAVPKAAQGQGPAAGGVPAKSGDASAGGAYPEWYVAANLPQYGGATVFEADDSQVTIDTTPTTDVRTLATYFIEEMTKLGWNHAGGTTGSSMIDNLDFKKDKVSIKIIVAKQVDGDSAKPTRATIIKLPSF